MNKSMDSSNKETAVPQTSNKQGEGGGGEAYNVRKIEPISNSKCRLVQTTLIK